MLNILKMKSRNEKEIKTEDSNPILISQIVLTILLYVLADIAWPTISEDVLIFLGIEDVEGFYTFLIARIFLFTSLFIIFFHELWHNLLKLPKDLKYFFVRCKKIFWKYFLSPYLIFYSMAIFSVFFGYLHLWQLAVRVTGAGEISLNQEGLNVWTSIFPTGMFIVTVIFVPFFEEIFLRLLIIKGIFRFKKIGILISSVIFAYLHVRAGDYAHIFPYFLMGLKFSFLYFSTKNIWVSILVHTFVNFL